VDCAKAADVKPSSAIKSSAGNAKRLLTFVAHPYVQTYLPSSYYGLYESPLPEITGQKTHWSIPKLKPRFICQKK